MVVADPGTVTDRRQSPRTPVGLPAAITRLGLTKGTGIATTRDLSEGGACLVGPDTFRVGDVVRVTVTCGDLRIEQQGLVVGRNNERDGGATFNVAFKTPTDDELDALRQIICIR